VQGNAIPHQALMWEAQAIMNDGTRERDFAELMKQVRAGSDEAAWELVDRYQKDVFRFVRRSLHVSLRAKFDSVDFVQIVWASFFRSPDRLQGIEKPEQFIAFLATVAKFKVLTEMRRRQTAKYDVNREQLIDDTTQPRHVDTPSAVAVARERWQRIVASENSKVREIVGLRLQGATFVEIAQQLSVHERTARKAIERLVNVAFE
jgi:RNA polymerase sigma factor (sigma-70 family)